MQTPSNEIKRLERGLEGADGSRDTLLWGVRTAMVVAVRAATVVAVLAVLGRGLWVVVSQVATAVMAGTPLRADELLVGLAALAAMLVAAWLSAGVLLVALATLPSAAGGWAAAAVGVVTPVAVRRAVGLLLGASVAAGIAPASSVATSPPAAVEGGVVCPVHPSSAPLPDPRWARDPGWVPEPPSVRPQPDVTLLSPAPRAASPDDGPEVVVRRGDSLWSIAARRLGPGSSDAEVAGEWPRWFAANRAVIGDDPDVLRPGQVLRAPERPAR